MLYISWMVLNLAASCLLLWLVYKAAVAVRHKFGWAASLLFIFGLLSFASAPKEKKENAISLANAQTPGRVNQVMHEAILKKYPLFTLHLNVVCNKMLDRKELEPVKAVAGQYGLVTGHQWQLTTATVNYNARNNTLEYNVYGTIRWKLLGIPVYAQNKTFVGRISVL